jgi:transglutaminase-like putative cysteine protease
MRIAKLHRKLVVLMSLASLMGFLGGAGVEALSATLVSAGLVLAFFWQPSPAISSRLERIWLPFALLLAVRALYQGFVIRGDIVAPAVDLLFLLLVAESLRSAEVNNDVRIYSLSFALLLASTAYRPGLLFLLAFLAYVSLATVVFTLGHLRREAARRATGDIPIPRSFFLTGAALSGVTLLVAAVVFLTFPRVSRGWTGRGESMATSLAGFADEVSLGSHGGRIYGNPQIVLRVEFPDGVPTDLQSLYWRGRSYDRFDGTRWTRTRRLPPSLVPTPWYRAWGGRTLSQRIYGAPLESRVLFSLHPLLELEAEPHVIPRFDNAGDRIYLGSGPPAYEALSVTDRPTPSQLRRARDGFVPARQQYTQVPALPTEVTALADSLLDHLPTDYDRAATLERWFQQEFSYTVELPRTPAEASLEHFLLRRREGHCEYFSTAMAILLRTQGMATREVNGFLGGTWSEFGNYLAVSQNQAHAWVEVWFPGYGWVPFDPTPAGRGDAMASTSWFWPGRFFFDAVQHRWNKWVLDYSFQSQFQLFEKGREILSVADQAGAQADQRPSRLTPFGTLVWILAGVLAVSIGFWAGRRRIGYSQVTRTFLRLRDAVDRAGAPASAMHSPGSLLGFLESAGHPATPAARTVIEGYLRFRFSGYPARTEEEEVMLAALKDALISLRKRPLR